MSFTMKLSSGGERVEEARAGVANVASVARDEREIVRDGRCREEAIDDGERSRRAHPAPGLGDAAIDRENPIGMLARQRRQPTIECGGLLRVAPADRLDATADLADDQHAEPDVGVGDRFEPARDAGVAALALADL